MFSHFRLNRKVLDMMGVYKSTNVILKHFIRYSKATGLGTFDSVLYYYYILSKRFTSIYPVWNENLQLIELSGYMQDENNSNHCMYSFTSRLETLRWLYAYRMTKNWLLNNYEESGE